MPQRPVTVLVNDNGAVPVPTTLAVMLEAVELAEAGAEDAGARAEIELEVETAAALVETDANVKEAGGAELVAAILEFDAAEAVADIAVDMVETAD